MIMTSLLLLLQASVSHSPAPLNTNDAGKLAYKRKVSNMSPEEIQVRRAKLREMEIKYKESLRVLAMVESSRRRTSRPSSPSAVGVTAVKRLLSPARHQPAVFKAPQKQQVAAALASLAAESPSVHSSDAVAAASRAREERIMKLRNEIALASAALESTRAEARVPSNTVPAASPVARSTSVLDYDPDDLLSAAIMLRKRSSAAVAAAGSSPVLQPRQQPSHASPDDIVQALMMHKSPYLDFSAVTNLRRRLQSKIQAAAIGSNSSLQDPAILPAEISSLRAASLGIGAGESMEYALNNRSSRRPDALECFKRELLQLEQSREGGGGPACKRFKLF
jgi:hypothetical protein